MGVSNDPITTLNELIQIEVDALRTYEIAIDSVADDDLEVREDLEAFQADHEQHLRTLTQIVQELGGEAEEPERDLEGVFLEGLTLLRAATGTVGTLRAMRINEQLTTKSYDTAAEAPAPPVAAVVIVQHLEDERRHLAVIELHLDRLAGEDQDRIEIDEDADEDIGEDAAIAADASTDVNAPHARRAHV